MRVRAQRHPSPASRALRRRWPGSCLHCPRAMIRTRSYNLQRHPVASRRSRNRPDIHRNFGLPGWLIICTLRWPSRLSSPVYGCHDPAAETLACMKSGDDQIEGSQHRSGTVDLAFNIFNIRLNTAQDPHPAHARRGQMRILTKCQ